VALSVLSSLVSCERASPDLESELADKGSLLLQNYAHVANRARLTLEEEPEHLPLCDPLVVDESCQRVNGIAEGDSPGSVTWALLTDMLSASSLEAAREAMALPLDEPAVDCMELCTATLQYVRSTGGVLPPFSNVACRTVHGNTTCDVEVDPVVLAQRLGSIEDMELPDQGPLTIVEDEMAGGSESDGRAFLYQEVVGHTSRSAFPAALLQRGMGVAGNATLHGEALAYTVWEAVERIANLFCVYPSSGKDVNVFVSSEPVLLQEGTTSADATVSYRASEAKAWLATVVRNVNGNREAAAQREWFGGAGGISEGEVRRSIVRTFNFIEREFARGFYFVTSADNAPSGTCNQGNVAYVWRNVAVDPNAIYEENGGPLCSSGDDPRRQNCGKGRDGRYYVYLCNRYLSQPADFQVSVLVHEAAHHAGPNDVFLTSQKDQMRKASQRNQLMNAANYQWFADTVTDGGKSLAARPGPQPPRRRAPRPAPPAGGDSDPNCAYYASIGYCSDDRIRRICAQSCGGGSPSPPPAPRPAPPAGGDGDPNCAYYASIGYCSEDRIRRLCSQSCCQDGDPNCAYYASIGYCSGDRINKLCAKSCGACR